MCRTTSAVTKKAAGSRIISSRWWHILPDFGELYPLSRVKSRGNKVLLKLLPSARPSGRQRRPSRRNRRRKQNHNAPRPRPKRQRRKSSTTQKRAVPLRSLAKKPRRGRTKPPGANGDRGWTSSRSLEREPAPIKFLLSGSRAPARRCRLWLDGRAKQPREEVPAAVVKAAAPAKERRLLGHR